MKKFRIQFKSQGAIIERIVEAPSRDYAMGCVCGFVISCEEIED